AGVELVCTEPAPRLGRSDNPRWFLRGDPAAGAFAFWRGVPGAPVYSTYNACARNNYRRISSPTGGRTWAKPEPGARRRGRSGAMAYDPGTVRTFEREGWERAAGAYGATFA